VSVRGRLLRHCGDTLRRSLALRNNLAAIDAGTGVATAWDPDPDDAVLPGIGAQRCTPAACSRAGGKTGATPPRSARQRQCHRVERAGGYGARPPGGRVPRSTWEAPSTMAASRAEHAALDATTGVATSWNPDANAWVVAALGGSTLYAAGTSRARRRRAPEPRRDQHGHAPRRRGAPTPTASCSRFCRTVVYFGGEFNHIGAVERTAPPRSPPPPASRPWDPARTAP
jgi:hypothetical protein